MTTLVTRARLLSTVLRTGDTPRIARLMTRFTTLELTGIIPALTGLDRRKLAAVLLDNAEAPTGLDHFDARSIALLVQSATAGDQTSILWRLLTTQERFRCEALMAIDEQQRRDLIDAQPKALRKRLIACLPVNQRSRWDKDAFGAAFRLHRLFAS